MKTHCSKLSPEALGAEERRRQVLIWWWNELRVSDDSGATTWEVLDSLERQVTECLNRAPPNVAEAESLTAQAALLIDGCCDL